MTNFHDLYEKYWRDVYRFSLYLSGDAATADDVTAETFVRVWTSAAPIRLATVKAYLFTIARNLYLGERRRLVKQRELSERVADPARDALHAAEVKEELQRVLEALREFAEVDRAALLMRAQGDMPYEEIAAVLGIPAATVKVKIHRTRLKLALVRDERA